VTLGRGNGKDVVVKQGLMSGEAVVTQPLTLMSAAGTPTEPAKTPDGSR
jgi:hypothetical protein